MIHRYVGGAATPTDATWMDLTDLIIITFPWFVF